MYNVPHLTGGKNCIEVVEPEKMELATEIFTKYVTRSGSFDFESRAKRFFTSQGIEDMASRPGTIFLNQRCYSKQSIIAKSTGNNVCWDSRVPRAFSRSYLQNMKEANLIHKFQFKSF